MGNSGVYQIVNNANGKKYIGSSADLRKRKNRHFQDLKRGVHHNQYLQRAYNKNGGLNIEFAIIFYCEQYEMIRYEQYFISKQHPEYNLCRTAGSVLGIKHGEEHRRKVAAARIGRKHSEETRKKMGEGVKASNARKLKMLYLKLLRSEKPEVLNLNVKLSREEKNRLFDLRIYYALEHGMYEVAAGNTMIIDPAVENIVFYHFFRQESLF